MIKNPIIFTVGDTVKYVGIPLAKNEKGEVLNPYTDMPFDETDIDTAEGIIRAEEGKIGVLHLILEVSVATGVVEYATDHGAWYAHAKFELVHNVTRESLDRAIALVCGNEDEEL